jgi:hypothetical protein
LKKLLEKALEYSGPIESFKQSGITLIYLSKEMKERKEIVFPDNVAHAIMPPVSDDFIADVEKKYNIQFPEIYKELVKVCNGFVLAKGFLPFDGLPTGLWKGYSQKEKWLLGHDVIRQNQYGPKNIVRRFFLIGQEYSTGNWIGIKDEKFYLINKHGKQLQEVNFYDTFIPLVEELNNHSEEIIKFVKGLYNIND